ncbi:ABC transporter transmembrane domain-containing protein [Streptomyces sp. NPDC060194]|uniref:ABC transporter transmembrane domain-containing protein n=1 Tax=Streptomyces sp. NPDC060194 TaxID=3347069 RepID=UPI0036521D15
MITATARSEEPEQRGPARYLWWLAHRQLRRVLTASVLGTLWMAGLTLPPYLLSRAIDDGLRAGDSGALYAWTGVLAVSGVVTGLVGMLRHRTLTHIRMDATFRTVGAVVRQSTRLGGALTRHVSAGEVVAIGITDVQRVSSALTVVGPGVGSFLAYFLVAGLLYAVSPLLTVMVLLGVPVIVLLLGPLLGRLESAERGYRERQGALTARIADLVAGLRVLNGLGGKELCAARYRAASDATRAEGYRVGAVNSWIQALGVGLPALFVAAVTWPAARMAARGEISVGELVSVYGYVAVLVIPVFFFIECGGQITRGLVAARRITDFLRLRADDSGDPDGTSAPIDAPAGPAVLYDPESGVELLPGRLTALVTARPADAAAVVNRLGRFAPSDATWGGLRLDGLDLPQVRARILVADNEADLFAGTLREVVAGRTDPAELDEETVAAAFRTAAAQDVVAGLPAGLDAPVDAQARNLSGGQRQRVRLVRALLADPETLLAVEPTSAVDAHTEAAVAARLRTARAGRTTLVTTSSPLVLEQADTIHYLADGRVAATGTHGGLLRAEPGYRALVAREAEPDEAVGPAPVPPARHHAEELPR